MAKQSALDKAIAALEDKRATLDAALQHLKDVKQAQVKPKVMRARRRREIEGATTDSGDLRYPPA